MRTYVLLIPVSALLMLSSACTTPQPQPQPAAPKEAAAPTGQAHGKLAQVMRGILFPNSNVIFYVQDKDPTKVKPAADPALSTDPLAGAYAGWTAVENSALALAESANLLTVPGRQCSNGRAVPVQDADWLKFVQGLRDAGMTAYKAAQSKNQDNMLMAVEAMTTACSNC